MAMCLSLEDMFGVFLTNPAFWASQFSGGGFRTKRLGEGLVDRGKRKKSTTFNGWVSPLECLKKPCKASKDSFGNRCPDSLESRRKWSYSPCSFSLCGGPLEKHQNLSIISSGESLDNFLLSEKATILI